MPKTCCDERGIIYDAAYAPSFVTELGPDEDGDDSEVEEPTPLIVDHGGES